MSKPVAAVRFEGTITENADPALLEFGKVKAGVREKLKDLEKTHFLLVVSSVAQFHRAGELLYRFLLDQEVPFGDLWLGSGLPIADLWVDDEAMGL